MVVQTLPIYLLNLDVDAERLERMRMQLELFELEWVRVSAVDGTTLPPQVLRQENRRARPRMLSPGEIGCLQSHVSIWRQIADGPSPAALVLEDDVLLASGFARIVNDVSWLPPDGIIRLETFCMPVSLGHQIHALEARGVYQMRSNHHGAAAYILTKVRAKILLQDYAAYIDSADRMMFCKPLRNNVYQLSPAPCVQYDIHKYGRRINNQYSRLQDERVKMERKSLYDPRSLALRAMWRFGELSRLASDIANGYHVRKVSYG